MGVGESTGNLSSSAGAFHCSWHRMGRAEEAVCSEEGTHMWLRVEQESTMNPPRLCSCVHQVECQLLSRWCWETGLQELYTCSANSAHEFSLSQFTWFLDLLSKLRYTTYRQRDKLQNEHQLLLLCILT